MSILLGFILLMCVITLPRVVWLAICAMRRQRRLTLLRGGRR